MVEKKANTERRSPQINGVVLHVLVQSQEMGVVGDDEICNFKNLCLPILKHYTNICSVVAANAIIGVFAEDSETVPELMAVKCIDEIRNMFYKQRENGAKAFMRASINGGEVIVGCSLGDDEYEVMGDAINASFQIIDTTHPMQVTITRRIRQKIQSFFNSVARRPVDIGIKKAQLYYLHTSTSEICAVPQNF